MVDGAAARALGALARERWARATGERIAVALTGSRNDFAPDGAPWPRTVKPDFIDVDIAIARTLPLDEGQPEVREAEALFHDMIARAEHSIYIENQFLTCLAVANALAQRMHRRPELEVLMVAPHTPDTWLESHTMRNGRIRFLRTLQESGQSAAASACSVRRFVGPSTSPTPWCIPR